MRLSTAAWHADNGAIFSSAPLSDSFEDVEAFQCKMANPRLVLALSRCLANWSIWPAVGPKSAVPFSGASVAVLWFLLFTCLRTPASISWSRVWPRPSWESPVPSCWSQPRGWPGLQPVPVQWVPRAQAAPQPADKGVTHLWVPHRGRLCSDTLS